MMAAAFNIRPGARCSIEWRARSVPNFSFSGRLRQFRTAILAVAAVFLATGLWGCSIRPEETREEERIPPGVVTPGGREGTGGESGGFNPSPVPYGLCPAAPGPDAAAAVSERQDAPRAEMWRPTP